MSHNAHTFTLLTMLERSAKASALMHNQGNWSMDVAEALLQFLQQPEPTQQDLDMLLEMYENDTLKLFICPTCETLCVEVCNECPQPDPAPRRLRKNVVPMPRTF